VPIHADGGRHFWPPARAKTKFARTRVDVVAMPGKKKSGSGKGDVMATYEYDEAETKLDGTASELKAKGNELVKLGHFAQVRKRCTPRCQAGSEPCAVRPPRERTRACPAGTALLVVAARRLGGAVYTAADQS
jgi:hypothetical protein